MTHSCSSRVVVPVLVERRQMDQGIIIIVGHMKEKLGCMEWTSMYCIWLKTALSFQVLGTLHLETYVQMRIPFCGFDDYVVICTKSCPSRELELLTIGDQCLIYVVEPFSYLLKSNLNIFYFSYHPGSSVSHLKSRVLDTTVHIHTNQTIAVGCDNSFCDGNHILCCDLNICRFSKIIHMWIVDGIIQMLELDIHAYMHNSNRHGVQHAMG